jgi:hypothetical protein
MVGRGLGNRRRTAMRLRSLAMGVLAAAAATHAGGLAAQEGEVYQWRGTLAPGKILEVKGVYGPVRAVPAGGATAEVRAEKSGWRSDPTEVRIEVVEHSDGVTVCAVYPSAGRRENRCEPGPGGRSSVRKNDVRVEFHVGVPEGVAFVGRSVYGDVEADDLTGDAAGYTVNGSVRISTSGIAEAGTVNGSIRAAMGGWDPDRGLRFGTVNGSIELELPGDAGAEIDARWVNGGLTAEPPLTLRGSIRNRRFQGTLGIGGPPLELSTVNGGIRIRQWRDEGRAAKGG